MLGCGAVLDLLGSLPFLQRLPGASFQQIVQLAQLKHFGTISFAPDLVEWFISHAYYFAQSFLFVFFLANFIPLDHLGLIIWLQGRVSG